MLILVIRHTYNSPSSNNRAIFTGTRKWFKRQSNNEVSPKDFQALILDKRQFLRSYERVQSTLRE